MRISNWKHISSTVFIFLATGTVSLTNAANCVIPPDGLVSWWKGEANALDNEGVNDGLLEGSIGFAPGEVGQSFLFNTANADVKIPASPSINVGNSAGFTLEAWIYPSNVLALGPLFEWNNGSGGWGVHFYVGAGGPGTLYANVVDNGGHWHQISSASGVVLPNVFQHVALTYSKNTGEATIYLNGTVAKQTNLGIFTPHTTFDLYLGRRRPGGADAYTFSGLLDEPSLYNRVLTQGEIQAIYNANDAGKCGYPRIIVSPQSQVGFWGKPLTLNVVAQTIYPLGYKWWKDGAPLTEATNASLSFASLDFTNAGGYSVVVNNLYGSVTSAPPANVVVNPAGVSIALYPGVRIDGVVGFTYGIQFTTDLSNTNSWIGVTNLTLTEPVEIWYDSVPATFPKRFYHVLPGPIPIP